MAIHSQILLAVDLTPNSLLIAQRGELWIPRVVPIPPEPIARKK